MMLNLISVTSLLLSSNLITSLMLCTALNQTFCVYLKICHAKWSDDYTYSSCWREEMWGLVNTISRAPRRCIILYRLDPALVEFTDDLQRPTETMLSAYVTNPQCRTHGHTVSSWCLCVQCSVTSQQWWQQPQAKDWEEEGTGRRAQLCHLAGALLQNRLFLHSALLCSTRSWKLPGSIKTQGGCSNCIHLLFYLNIFLQCFALDLEVCEIVFCLPHPSN